METFFTHRFKVIFILFFFGFCSLNYSTKAQDPLKSLRVIGNSVFFNYNTLSQYDLGITLNSWTTVRIRFQFTGSNGWELRLFSNDDAIKFEGDPINDIALTDLTVIPTIVSQNDITIALNGGFVLDEGPYDESNPNQVIVSGAGGTTGSEVIVELTLTYILGSMLNKPDGLYYTSLYMLLVEK